MNSLQSLFCTRHKIALSANTFLKRDNDGDYGLSIEVLGLLEALIQSLHATHRLNFLRPAISFLNRMEMFIIDHIVLLYQ